MFYSSEKTLNFYNKPPTGNTNPSAIHTKCWKHSDRWESIPFTLKMTFLIVNILSVFLASSRIFVQRKKYLRWRDVRIFFKNWSATRRSQLEWPLTFWLNEQYAASFYLSRFKYRKRSLNTQNVHRYCSSKNVLLMCQIDLDPWIIDLNLSSCWDILTIRICCTVRLFNGTITGSLRKGSAYRCKMA